MNRKPVLAGAAAALALALAPSAFAQDYCVADASCVSGGGTDEPTVQAALTAADGTIEADRVLIGPGTYTAPDDVGFFATVHPVQVIGSGSESTVLTGPTDTDTVLLLGQGSSVSDLGIAMPANSTNSTKVGLQLNGAHATRVKVTADPALSTVGIGIFPFASLIEDSVVDLPTAPTTVGISAQHDTTVRHSEISARNGMNAQGAHVHFERDVVKAKALGVNVVNSANDVDATDSLIQMTGFSTAVSAGTGNNTDAGITLRGDTIVGDGTPGNVGVASASSKPFLATVNIDSSIVRGFSFPARRVATGTGATADLSIQYSDLDTAAATSTGAGTLTLGPGNIDADPLFAGASDFHLLAGSPAIDAGNPADLGDLADFDGGARVLDGDGDSIATRDMGAFEAGAAQTPPPVDPSPVDPPPSDPPPSDPPPASDPGAPAAGGPSTDTAPSAADSADAPASAAAPFATLTDRTPPTITGLRARRGGRLTFTLSEYAVVRIVVTRRSNDARLRKVGTVKRVFGNGPAKVRLGRLGGKTLRPGSYVAKLTAVDAARNRSRDYTVRFRVVR